MRLNISSGILHDCDRRPRKLQVKTRLDLTRKNATGMSERSTSRELYLAGESDGVAAVVSLFAGLLRLVLSGCESPLQT